jgi:hypothetical protein
MDGISSPVDECEKIWFLYPGANLNLSLMHNEHGQHAKFARLGGLLEGGMVVRTTLRDALYISAGFYMRSSLFEEGSWFLLIAPREIRSGLSLGLSNRISQQH